MSERELVLSRAQGFLEKRRREENGPEAEPSEFDQANHERQVALLSGRRYADVLELGCGSGFFTRRLAEIADRVIALDVAPAAIARARTLPLDRKRVEFRLASPMDYDVRAEGPWDLVVMSETIYDYGWLYPLFDVGWLASELFTATRDGGRFLMANTYRAEEQQYEEEYVLSPWLIDTYRDLFLNVGYRREAEEVRRAGNEGVEYKTLITLFAKPDGSPRLSA
jgi:SAM-dependent methyltransferase